LIGLLLIAIAVITWEQWFAKIDSAKTVRLKPDRQHTFPRVVFLTGRATTVQRNETQGAIIEEVYYQSPALRNIDQMPDQNSSGQCTLEKWQKASHPNCNDIHSLSMADLLVTGSRIFSNSPRNQMNMLANLIRHKKEEQGLVHIFRSGANRISGVLVKGSDSVIYKTQRYKEKFIPDLYERARVEAMAMDILKTAAVNVYGFCGVASLTEYGDGGNLATRVREAAMEPLKKLEYALNLSKVVADMHSVHTSNNYSSALIHGDLDASNVVAAHGRLKLIDFHQALLIPWSRTTNSPCYPSNRPTGPAIDTRAPDIAKGDTLDEKVDIYGLGALLFYILTEGARLYHCERPRGSCNYGSRWNNTLSDLEIRALKEKGVLPSLPEEIEQSSDQAIKVIRETMKLAVQADPKMRPTAENMADKLNKTWGALAYGEAELEIPEEQLDCNVLEGARRNITEPLFVASYPGSGSEMMLNIIVALTGVRTVSHGGRCDPPEMPYDYAALKTHYPWHCKNAWQHGMLSNVIVLIRNPIDSFPSKANRQYETDTNIRSHSTQAPEDYWKQWRNEHFAVHLSLWEELVHYWMNNYTSTNRLVLPYEELAAEDSGQTHMQQIARFLIRTGAKDSVVSFGEAGCLWREVVARDKGTRRANTHRSKTYRPTFTAEQYDAIAVVLSRLIQKYKNENFGPALVQYEKAVREQRNQIIAGSNEDREPARMTQKLPKIAWLMSYPNSYNTKIRRLLQDVTKTTGATNYGRERISSTNHTFDSPTSIPVYPDDTNGPFVISDDLPLPEGGFILTKTHCGVNGCRDCNIAPAEQFLDECVRGSRVTSDGRSIEVRYNASIAQRAVHLFLSPFSNVATRFQNSGMYPSTREGFLDWCRAYDELYVGTSKQPELVPDEVLNSDVLCHTEFYKYVQWHNNAARVIEHLKLPVHTLFAEDFSGSHFNSTVSGLLDFLDLKGVESGSPFETIRPLEKYFTPTETQNVVQFIKHHATKQLWLQLHEKYFSNFTLA